MWIKTENGINDAATVKKQYATSTNLNKRISIHDKYSTNKQGFGNWIASHYDIRGGMSVLELGCGTGDMWTGKQEMIRRCSRLVLSDFSEGMLDKAKETLRGADPSPEEDAAMKPLVDSAYYILEEMAGKSQTSLNGVSPQFLIRLAQDILDSKESEEELREYVEQQIDMFLSRSQSEQGSENGEEE